MNAQQTTLHTLASRPQHFKKNRQLKIISNHRLLKGRICASVKIKSGAEAAEPEPFFFMSPRLSGSGSSKSPSLLPHPSHQGGTSPKGRTLEEPEQGVCVGTVEDRPVFQSNGASVGVGSRPGPVQTGLSGTEAQGDCWSPSGPKANSSHVHRRTERLSKDRFCYRWVHQDQPPSGKF